ncbi:hypothetical protein [Rubrivivax gelatinosus]|uniref:hypothetical protein n=1 Tax=Rubrivivax gelatinosus TaxID=28068 RepID=UPI0010519E45|nr:hypothetical protein [Rubrivivax gelatinosus]
MAKLREQARAQLRDVRIASAEPALCLEGHRAEVVDESENVIHDDGRVDGFYLTWIARNEHGEYFLLKTTDARPYVKHLPQDRARIVLKSKYIAPGDRAPTSDASQETPPK